ncbi:MAG: 6-pyruvoyl trahydropterin synthase family protein [Solidesulfovibrio sp. DCME]|uniref:6-pyruvoyl trahydropterin synthase family protein n=1 Tax=Solidesulfovibrio sp. DCME TaxID=3447380 RepID=UPI003D136DFC
MAATYTISVSTSFSAAHRLPDHPGPCAALHGHNFEVTAQLAAPRLAGGMVADFLDVRAALDAATSRLDHSCLNDIPELSPPTAEVIAAWIYGQLRDRLADGRVRVARVTVVESPGLAASYAEDA